MDTVTDRRWDAYRVYLITSAAIALFQALIFTVNLLFQVERVGLNALQLVLVGTALEGAAFIFEIPPAWSPTCTAGGCRSSSATSSWASG